MLEHSGGVAMGRGGQRRGPARREGPHVHLAVGGVLPAQVAGRHRERGTLVEDAAQVVQLTPEVRQGLLVGRVRPEQRSDALAGLRPPGVDHEERDEFDGSRRAHAHRAVRVADGLLAQEGDLLHRGVTSDPAATCRPPEVRAPSAVCQPSRW